MKRKSIAKLKGKVSSKSIETHAVKRTKVIIKEEDKNMMQQY
jgi:hypothetical protein